MMNMGENRVQNGVTDCPESQNEVSVEKWKKWSSRYAMEKLRFLRGTRCLKISEISPDFSAVREAYFSYLRDHIRERLYESRSSFYPQNFSRLVSLSQYQKSSSLELYLVNPCGAEQESLIVLLADNPFAGRIASPLVSSDNTVRMHVTLV
ncbi:hypothetical protein E3N88_31269 [Mikania micrantha]|uniref:Uncharacterized protein n=1 Tax=Mikania micrantha TaxID=192012 RepID=A0A5N6MNY1_9ASTR|nr:hypothetical protein E3N88_31269 [Mikania micrantha]